MGCCSPGTPPNAYYEKSQAKTPGFANVVTTLTDYAALDTDTGVDARSTSATLVTLPPNPQEGQEFTVTAIGHATNVAAANQTTQSIVGQAGGPPATVSVSAGTYRTFRAAVNSFATANPIVTWY